MKATYPGGWVLADDSCMQYVRRTAPRAFELIEYGLVSHDGPLYAVYTDTICLDDYSEDELNMILNGFGYEDMEDLRGKCGTYDAANQIAAECIFEWYGSHAVEPLCTGVPKDAAGAAVLAYIDQHGDACDLCDRVEVSAEELARKAAQLSVGEEMTFFAEEDGDSYGIARAKFFDAEVLVINYFGGGTPYIIDIERSLGNVFGAALDGLTQYVEDAGINAIFIDEHTATAEPVSACREVRDLREMDRGKLLTRDEVLDIIRKHGDNDAGVVKLRDHYCSVLGFDPIWRQHVGDDAYYGAVIIPVREGYLYIPYNDVSSDGWELYLLDLAGLLTAEETEYLLKLTAQYMEPYQDVLRHIVWELREKEAAKGE